MNLRAVVLLLVIAVLPAACSTPARGPATTTDPAPGTLPPLAVESPPEGRLPSDVRPTHYDLTLEIDPDRARFTGEVSVSVELDQARDVIWMHGQDLAVTSAVVELPDGRKLAAALESRTEGGVMALTLPQRIGPTRAVIHVTYDAPYGRLQGLYTVQTDGEAYAFTQLESVFARSVFPCFDEPAFKTPFDITLRVPRDEVAIGNTPIQKRSGANAKLDEVTFRTTPPLPTYLLAFAVGPLDVVEAVDIPPNEVRKRPLALRGVATKGRGKELAYALRHTGPLLATLEDYFGTEYPYAKLDIIAVPDKGGAMENAGAITFREWLLLIDEATAPVDQRRAFAYVMAHELAHQWFGNLVTMPWWDDIWLNEAFATWMGFRAVHAWDSSYQGDVSMLRAVHSAMDADALSSARKIRNEVVNNDDILNAFDRITYRKGGGVLSMFERWVGPEPFKQGIRAYVNEHRFGSATADDLLAALDESTGRDVGASMVTFLEQTGVPFVEAELRCDGVPMLELRQSRFLPVGSEAGADRTWKIPVCARFPVGGETREACARLDAEAGELALEGAVGCPAWVMPNSDGAGYYHFSLPRPQLDALAKQGLAALTVRERMSFAVSVRAGMDRGTIDAADALALLAPLADDPHPSVATKPMALLRTAHDWFHGTPTAGHVADYGRQLYAKQYQRLGWTAMKGDSAERRVLRREVLGYLALDARNPVVAEEATKRAMTMLASPSSPSASMDPDIADVAFAALGMGADELLFGQLVGSLQRTKDPVVRGRYLSALSRAREPHLSERIRDMMLQPSLQVTEMLRPIETQLSDPAEREAAVTWMEGHLDAVIRRLPPGRAGRLPSLFSGLCDPGDVGRIEHMFGPRRASLPGGPRNLMSAEESVTLCAAQRAAHSDNLRRFFAPGAAPR